MSDLRTAAQKMLRDIEDGLPFEHLDNVSAPLLRAALEQQKPPPEAQTEAEKIAYCAGWWAAMEQKREQPERATITVQEAWEAAGGNPGIKATKEELITALQLLDKVCDEAPLEQPEQEPLSVEEIDRLWREPMSADWEHREFARAIEAAHGIKGGA